MRRVGYIGEGAFSKRLPYVGFFWFFSCRSRKEHYCTKGYKKVYILRESKRPARKWAGLFAEIYMEASASLMAASQLRMAWMV